MKVGRVHETNTLQVLGEQNERGSGTRAKVEKLFTSLGIQYTLHKINHGSMRKHVGAMAETMAKDARSRVSGLSRMFDVVATLESGNSETVNGTTYVNLGATADCAWPTALVDLDLLMLHSVWASSS
ncbi:hypothetical protein CYMTET_14850 [Cymbomonas tetramitiformis]|uniref:Uncharacterized protein n=1 Tax=Cymbomonas tetramitiformis TaxID=36881 RepID=A0AAE0GFS8_9CHLO|nr:hypothetical protein CYMTET_14850 [Cymbomonas tetramitiformis]